MRSPAEVIREGLMNLKQVATDRVHIFTPKPETALACAGAFGFGGEFDETQLALRYRKHRNDPCTIFRG